VDPPLTERDLGTDPLEALRVWLTAAEQAGLTDPTTMVVATATADGQPSARAVLCKGVDARGVRFYTNLESGKGIELRDNPRAAAAFVWTDLHRQIRLSGAVELVGEADADVYFATRPRGAQLGAWASPQSRVIADRALLEDAVAEAVQRFGDGEIPRPPFWGGYRIVAETVEFWQGRPDRLHDRLRYRQVEGSRWLVERLAP
jgi:pyridoxamine 5'-phosphate oxidase